MQHKTELTNGSNWGVESDEEGEEIGRYTNEEINRLTQAIGQLPSYDLYMERSEKYPEDGHELALSDIDKAIALNPTSEAYYKKGNIHMMDDEYKLAIDDYNEAIKIDDNIEAYFNRATAHVLLGQPEKALETYSATLNNKSICTYDYDKRNKAFIFAVNLANSLNKYYEAKEFIRFLSLYASDREEEKQLKVHLKLVNTVDGLDRKNKERKKELEEKNNELELLIQQKESLQTRMQKLVEQFTHSLGNVIFPDTIYQVAERLKNNPECRKDVLLLHEAYHSEIIIKLQGELLRQRYANTNPEKFRRFIRSCRRTQNHADKTKSIEEILDYAASRVAARFLNQHYAGLNSIRDNILSKKNVSLDALKQKFEDDILLNKSLRPIAWVNQNLRPIQITEISPLWKKVFILSESHAEALLFGYFSEILFNAFKYADHDKDEFLTLVFDEKNIDDKTYLTCSWQNPVKDKSQSMLGTGKGLDAIQEDLKQLNDTENPEESLLISQQKNQFQVTLFFKKDLLVNELPSLKIKRKANVE
ncbi:MAG: tetratricopeptide repeat protein [Methylobacter sp.]|uniref:tetratricopeptide repeat protein n=1 Tax=Methylobacter sp. TaxID=2051955 RepID=UPI00272F6389|nr:tetratricopeptide repeat protein [Methylobacter sp.]MDP1663787.1 tetratricopeptide repeat protein [Methylobacter sp.]